MTTKEINMSDKVELTTLIADLRALKDNMAWNYICIEMNKLREECDISLHANRKDSYSDDILKECIDMIDNMLGIPEKGIDTLRTQILTIISNEETSELEKKYGQNGNS